MIPEADDRVVERKWPDDPYKGLVYYGPEDRWLFSGREDDLHVCSRFLTAPETRIVLLHGQTGCGKSSFLRAGLIPALEHRYLFLRDATGTPLFIRCGADPIARIAEHIYNFASKEVRVDTETGETTFDLRNARLGCSDIGEFVELCRRPGKLLKALHEISARLPQTLVVVVDQAEEVITLNEHKYEPCRWQFFRFVKEFATTNFPVKFVVALRKDYSGDFLGRAVMGSSIEIPPEHREMVSRDSRGAAPDRQVKSDLKIFLLPELDADAVRKAIELPTSTSPELGNPHAKYQFTYAPGVAQRIVHDVVKASSGAAMLPVMQIVCRDLYKRVKDRPNREIDDALYDEGKGITGPIDRHISDSLRAGFRGMQGIDAVAEETIWRKILFKLVRHESDGTVHTNIVNFGQLKEDAAALGAKADVRDVVDYLARPDVLLLRHVTMLSTADTEDARLYSLGHDTIGTVLQQWNVRAVAEERMEADRAAALKKIEERRVLAEEQIARKQKESERRIRIVTLASGCALLVFAVIVAVAFQVAETAKTTERHDGLLRLAQHDARNAPVGAMLAAAHASRDEEGMLYRMFKEDPWEAHRLLATMLPGLPKSTAFSKSATPEPGTQVMTVALPKLAGFARVDNAKIDIVTGLGGEPSHRSFPLDPVPKPADLTLVESSTAVSERGDGTILLLRTMRYIPTVMPSSPSLGGMVTDQELHVFVNERQVGRVSLDEFLKRVPPQAGTRDPPPERGVIGALVPQRSPELKIAGGTAVVVVPRAGYLHVVPFVADSTSKESGFPFTKGPSQNVPFPDESTYPLFFENFVLTPQRRDIRNDSGESRLGFVKYKLGSDQPAAENLPALDRLTSCKQAASCEWQIVFQETVDNFLLLGAFRPDNQPGGQSYSQASRPEIDRLERFVIFDVATNEGIVLGKDELMTARSGCSDPLKQRATPGPARASQRSQLFVSGANQSILLGVLTDNTLDLMRSGKKTALPTCIGTLLVGEKVDGWKATPDGKTVLAAGVQQVSTWNVSKPFGETAEELMKDKGGLRNQACSSGVKELEASKEPSIVKAYLGEQAVPVCEVERNPGTRRVRAGPGFAKAYTAQ